MNKNIFLFLLALIVANNAHAQDCVVLLHGLAKSDRDMAKIAHKLSEEGYKTVNFDYQSTSGTIEKLSNSVISSSLKRCGNFEQVHFVTHSMGGLLVRHYLAQSTIDRLGRVVMLGPPNKGSEAVDVYRNFPGFSTIGGLAGLQLGTGKMSIPKKLGSVDFDLGIIAGTRSVNLILSSILPGKDDGKVTVESTKVDGMDDHIAMPVTHPFMMKNKYVIKQVIHYLKTGKFYRT